MRKDRLQEIVTHVFGAFKKSGLTAAFSTDAEINEAQKSIGNLIQKLPNDGPKHPDEKSTTKKHK